MQNGKELYEMGSEEIINDVLKTRMEHYKNKANDFQGHPTLAVAYNIVKEELNKIQLELWVRYEKRQNYIIQEDME